MNPFTDYVDEKGNLICPLCREPVAMMGPDSMKLCGMCGRCVRERNRRQAAKIQAEIDAEVEKILEAQ